MAKFRFNIFYVLSIIGTLFLVGYLWVFFLPTFEHSLGYHVVRNVVVFLTVLLIASAILTLLQMKISE